MHTIHRLYFNIPLRNNQVPAFRGSLIKAMGNEAHPLMHNHTDEGLRFGYPTVQYNVLEGKASLVAFDEVGEHIQNYFENKNSVPLVMHKKLYECKLEHIQIDLYTLATSDQPIYYSINQYIPLTGDNVQEYDSLMALTDKICLLEKIMTGNILSFFKGIDYHVDEQIVCVITSIEQQHTIKYKGVHFRAFDMHFVSNVLLPDYIGLGKSTSIGMGTIKRLPLPKEFLQFSTNEKS